MSSENLSTKVDELYVSDQADRTDKDWSDMKFVGEVMQRDTKRLQEAKELFDLVLREGTEEDVYKLSYIFQHGDTPDDYLKAHDLAKRAMDLGHPLAPKMVANSYDRWMIHTTNPRVQKYGTQSQWVEEQQKYVMFPVDPLVTDEERSVYQVLPLAELVEYVARLKRNNLK